MILHFVTDEKFTDYAIKQFSAPEMESEFVLIPSNYTPGNDVVEKEKCRIVKQRSPEFKELLSHLGDYSAIVLHGMHWPNWEAMVLKSVPNNVKVAWVFWGGDLYGRADVHESFLAPLTKLMYRYHLRGAKPNKNTHLSKELFSRVDYIMTSVREEYEYAKNYLGSNVKFLWYTYYSKEQTIGLLMEEKVRGENIWIGNSASAENNLFEAFLRLFFYGLGRRSVYCPLSYGAPWIKIAAERVGKWLFGTRFVPLKVFLPRDEYNKLMLGCSTMIMNHINPQAQGNVITGLWLGMRVYMNEKSMTYQYLKRIGCVVFSIQKDLKRWDRNRFAPLSDEEVAQNRKAIGAFYSQEYMAEANQKIVNELNTYKNE